MSVLTFECVGCGAVCTARQQLNLTPLNKRSICPSCHTTQLLYDAALSHLENIQGQLIKEWVAYWVAAGVPRDSLLSSDPSLCCAKAIQTTLQAIRLEVEP